METLEEIFNAVGCKKVFNKNGDLTTKAIKKYYDKAMAYYCNKYNKKEDDFDNFVNECIFFGY